jgi:hypothetical protein
MFMFRFRVSVRVRAGIIVFSPRTRLVLGCLLVLNHGLGLVLLLMLGLDCS